MRLSIKSDCYLNYPLLRALIKQNLIKYFKLNLTGYRVEVVTNYLQSSLNIDWSCMRVLTYMVNHLKITSVDNIFTCTVDNNILLPNTNYRLLDIVKLIEYGNMEVKGVHIIDNAFDYIENNIGKILLRMIW